MKLGNADVIDRIGYFETDTCLGVEATLTNRIGSTWRTSQYTIGVQC